VKGACLRIALTFAGMLCMAVAADAQQRPLPAFTVTTAPGVAASSGQLNDAARWLLVYVTPESVASERLLRSLDDWAALDGARVVIVAAGEASISPQVRSLLPTSAAAVYADPDGSAARALGVTSVPALVGVASGAIDWMVQGVLNDPRMVEPVVRSWLGR
jgi:hypothetical protein